MAYHTSRELGKWELILLFYTSSPNHFYSQTRDPILPIQLMNDALSHSQDGNPSTFDALLMTPSS